MNLPSHTRKLVSPLIAALVGVWFCAVVARAADDGKISLFNGKDLSGWKLRNPTPETKNSWKVVSDVKLDQSDPKNLIGTGEGGTPDAAMYRGKIAHGSDIMTEQKFGDC